LRTKAGCCGWNRFAGSGEFYCLLSNHCRHLEALYKGTIAGGYVVLFSRVRGAVGEIEGREWALLCLETIGVLIGIFVAFRLNEWAMSRREAARDLQLVDRLFEESQRNVSWLRGQRERDQALVSREMKFATTLVHDGRCPADDDSWQSVFTVAWYPALVVETSVYDEMMGAGGLATIENPVARQAVSRFQTFLGSAKERTSFSRARADPAIPIDHPSVTVSFNAEQNDPEEVTFDRTALCGDAAFKKRVADKVRDHAVVMSERGDLVGWSIEMCSSLGRMVGKRCVPFRGGPLTGQDAKIAEAIWKEAGQN
jgi:hypothetical protein